MRPLCAARPLALESLYENMRAKRLICASAVRSGDAVGHSCDRWLAKTVVYHPDLGAWTAEVLASVLLDASIR